MQQQVLVGSDGMGEQAFPAGKKLRSVRNRPNRTATREPSRLARPEVDASQHPKPGAGPRSRWVAGSLLFALFGCGGSSSPYMEGSGGGCPVGQQLCGTACVDVSADPNNCGSCGISCEVAELCQDGSCVCQPGLQDCAGQCVDTLSDGNHCGSCGNVCNSGQVCSSGECGESCGAGETACGSSCVDLLSSVLHCGACNNACASGQTCTDGACSCATEGQVMCNGSCTDPLTDNSNCGGCGIACGPNQTCVAGSCTDTAGSTGGTGGATGSGGSGGTATGGVDGTGGAPVSCATPLAERVSITPVAVSPEVSLGRGQWGSTGLPVILAASPNGRAKVAWSDGSNVHVTPLDASGQRAGDDALVTGSEARGLVAHDDGSAVLVVQGDEMVFVRLSEAGAIQASLSIVGNNSHSSDGDRWIDDWPHRGRLAWSGSQYAAYFGQTGNFGSQGDHQGDHYELISPEGSSLSGGWDWGCSHSLDVRLAHNGSVFAPICTSDTYPGAGIWFNNRVEVSREPSITNVGGGTKLGGLVPAPDGFWLSFTSPEQRSSYDVVFLHIDNEGSPSGRVHLTDTAADEEFSHLAAYGDGLLAGWGSATELSLAALDASGSVVEGPVTVSAQAGGLDDFVTYPNGDVGWAYAWGELSTLQVIRVARCE